MTFKLIQGDNRVALKALADNSVDAIVTDPPYGIDFLGKAWDANTGALETYQECLRVLKPGGHILAFSAARTYHHLAVTLEQAGFEIRDQIMWIYSSGFPKSQDVGKSIERSEGKRKKLKNVNSSEIIGMGTQCPQCGKYENGSNQKKCPNDPCPLKEVLKPANNEWAGWGTALKPAHEPIALARKPMKLSTAKNVQKWNTGALNIDATRVPWGEDDDPQAYIEWMKKYPASTGSKAVFSNAHADAKGIEYIKDQDAEINDNRNVDNRMSGRFPSNVLGDIPDYQKYFYCPKVSRRERHMGFDLEDIPTNPEGIWDVDGTGVQYNAQKNKQNGNNHPTVKPVALMEYLIKLITPQGGTVLDPFNGSGSTGMAAVGLGYNYIGIDLDANYIDISRKRIEAWLKRDEPQTNPQFNKLFEDNN